MIPGRVGLRGHKGHRERKGKRAIPESLVRRVLRALDAQFIQFAVDGSGNLILNYTGAAYTDATYKINDNGELEVTYA